MQKGKLSLSQQPSPTVSLLSFMARRAFIPMPLVGPPDTDRMLPAGRWPWSPDTDRMLPAGADRFFMYNLFMNVYGHDKLFTFNVFNHDTGLDGSFTGSMGMHAFIFTFIFNFDCDI